MIDIGPSQASPPSQTVVWSLLRAPLMARITIAGAAIVTFWLAVLAALR